MSYYLGITYFIFNVEKLHIGLVIFSQNYLTFSKYVLRNTLTIVLATTFIIYASAILVSSRVYWKTSQILGLNNIVLYQ